MVELPTSRSLRRFPKSPRLWVPLALEFTIAFVAVSAAFALSGGNTVIVRKQCVVGGPGCETRREIHEHADFAVFLRGKQVDFAQFMAHEDNPSQVETADMHPSRRYETPLHRGENTTLAESMLPLFNSAI